MNYDTGNNWKHSDNGWEPSGTLPFFEEIETTTWEFIDGSILELEKNEQGYLLGGHIGNIAIQDEDWEDLFFPDTDSLLNFFQKHNLLKLLSKKQTVS